MKKILARIGILFVIFIIALIGFSSLLNGEKTENTAEVEEPTLPVICMDYEGILINQMYGYTQEMQVDYLRNTLTPLETSRELTIAVQPYGNKIKQITYEVRTADNETVVENGKITNFKEDQDVLKADFKIQNAILMNQEYSLKFTLTVNDKQVHYYTRLIQRAGLNVSKYLEFVQDFYEKCTNKSAEADLAASLEPDDSTTNSSFTEINIHSSKSQVTWGNLNPQIYRKAIPAIKEINETTGSIGMDYMISAQNDQGKQELYYVTDFYRMRYYQSKVMLLDFERSAKQLFDGELAVMTSTGMNLGIRETDVQYVSNQSGDIVAFVQQGELWSYNKSASKIVRVYSFRNTQVEDERNDYLAHDIKIVRVEENGEIDFVLYGYMNKDVHEGEAGIGVYHYSPEKNAVEEKIFIPMSKSFEFLKSDLELLSYVNKQNKLYLYLDESLYEVDFQNKTYKVIKEGIDSDCFVIAKNQSHVAWMEEMQENDSKNITVMDFETGETTTVSAGEGERIKALGFMNDDFVYGLAKENAIIKETAGNVTFGMYCVRIQNFEGEVIKEYAQENTWISKVTIKEGLIELDRVIWENNQYQAIANDHIMNNLQQSEKNIEIKSTLTNTKGRQISLIFQTPVKDKSPLVLYSKMYDIDENDTMDMKTKDNSSQNVYYVYAKGKLDSIFTKVNEAVKRADEGNGVVLNSQQQYIWERGNRPTKLTMNNEDIPESILAGTIDEEALQEQLGENYTILNFAGCTLDNVLYQIGQERAVVVKISETETRVIVGYDIYNTWLYNPETKEVKPYGLQDSTALFEEAGNVFVSYIEKLPEVKITQ